MKFIDNRFRIQESVEGTQSHEAYIALDLLDNKSMKYLTLYTEEDQRVVDYFIMEYSNISKIRHKNLVSSESFQMIETVNFKKNDIPLYYTVNEYIDAPFLSMANTRLKFKDKMKIILDLMDVISYLHFKGVTYRYLSPDNIFILNNKDIKLMDLGTIMSNVINFNYNSFTDKFVAPEVIEDRENTNKKADYYSLGMVIRYLLCSDFCTRNCIVIDSKYHSNLKEDEKEFWKDIIYNLTQKKFENRNIYLRQHMDNIIERFELDYKYDLISESPKELFSLKDKIELLNAKGNILSDRENSIRRLHSIKKSIKTLEELLCNLGQDYQQNLDLILSYIQNRTLADRGYILLLDEDSGDYKIISTLSEDDDFLPNRELLCQASKSEMGILFNLEIEDICDDRYEKFLPDGSSAIICVSIIGEHNRPSIDKCGKDISENRDKCYIYLESKSYFNNFNYESLVLLKTLCNMIYLNIENHLLKIISTMDKLTGTLTRKYFDIQLDLSIDRCNKEGGRFSLLMLDVDNFKDINDNYGHLKGDRVLMEVGKVIKDSVRATDLVGRYGGEEFILILFNVEMDDAIMVGENLRKRIEGLEIAGINKRITVSGGLSHYPYHGRTKNELIGKADMALYYAKEVLGKNHIVTWTCDMGDSFVDY
ncbi:diguanylate cyclase [Tissierellaceae bacterium HCP3S3_D8]